MHFCIRCIDKTDAGGLRQQVRPQHLEYLKMLGARIVIGGPMLGADETTPIGSMLVVEAPDWAAVEQLAAKDPYAVAGLFGEVTITPYRIGFIHPPAA
ncbi:MAG TPA: YciI family protein [Aliidongia sp.]|nr:YciI family protein [Aliidongia sp.]